jgi:hypothetical protein
MRTAAGTAPKSKTTLRQLHNMRKAEALLLLTVDQGAIHIADTEEHKG